MQINSRFRRSFSDPGREGMRIMKHYSLHGIYSGYQELIVEMKSNITLIGMPGAGKSTVGIILAKYLSFGFLDTDILIQMSRQKSLQQIISESDHLNLRKIEEEEILKVDVASHVIATGGSAVYSNPAMLHLQGISQVVFLNVSFENIKKRIHDFDTRGIAKADTQTFEDLFHERQALYREHADVTVDCNELNQEEVARRITSKVGI